MAQYTGTCRVRFYLSDLPEYFASCEHLRPIFEEFKPVRPPWSSGGIAREENISTEFEEFTDRLTEIPAIRNAIIARAEATQEEFVPVENGVIWTIQECYYSGARLTAKFLIDLLKSDPALGVDFTYAIRMLSLIPREIAPEFSHAYSFAELSRQYGPFGIRLREKNVVPATDIAAVLQANLSFPAPNSWDDVRWCEDHLAIADIRKAFALLRPETEKLGLSEGVDEFRAKIQSLWDQRTRSYSRRRASILWGTSLAIGAATTLVTAPMIGLLTSLGVTVASNLWLEGASELAAKILRPADFHIWRLRRSLGRRA